MASLASLLPYLEQGYTIRSESSNETYVPLRNGKAAPTIIRLKQETKSRPAEHSPCTLAEVRRLGSIWEWGVVFLRKRGANMQEYVIEDITAIEKAIQAGQPHTLFDDMPTLT